MKILSERLSPTDDNTLISVIVEYNNRLFKIIGSPIRLFVWSGFNGWLYIDNGDSKQTTNETINQFTNIMETFTNEKEN